MIERASETTLLVDHGKFGRFGLLRICAPEALRRLVSDAPLPAELAQALRHKGVEVVMAAADRESETTLLSRPAAFQA